MNVEESLYKTRGGELEAWWSWSLASLCLQAAVQLLEERSRFCSNFFFPVSYVGLFRIVEIGIFSFEHLDFQAGGHVYQGAAPPGSM